MFSESKVTEIYCLADDFCKEFAVQQEKYMIEDKSRPHRNKPNRMSDAEIMVILIFFVLMLSFPEVFAFTHMVHPLHREISFVSFSAPALCIEEI